jgi:glycosyltransferase involved in cell wall biosynthesis
MSVIPNGIDIERVMTASPAEDIMEDKRFKVLMVSAFRPEKDQMTLIRAMARLPEDCVLLLAGGAELPAHRTLMDSCRHAAEEFGIADRVRFLGVRGDIPALMAASDVIVLSSLHEGLSLSVLEGMASGKPLVASDVPGLSDIVAGAGLLFPCGDSERLAQIIGRLREDESLREGIARSCRERAERYDIWRTVDGYRDLYEQIPSLRSE